MPTPTFSELMRRYLDERTGQFLAIEDGVQERIEEALAAAADYMDRLVLRASERGLVSAERLMETRRAIERTIKDFGGLAGDAIKDGRRAASIEGATGMMSAARAAAEVLDIGLDWRASTVTISRDAIDYIARYPLGGMPLSQRVWQVTDDTVRAVFGRLNSGIIGGEGAQTIARDIRQHLLDPKGQARLSGQLKGLRTRARAAQRAQDYERAARLFASASEKEKLLAPVGRGVYRSAHQNAMRVARSELLRAHQGGAYRYGERKRWVVGYRWQPNVAACEICKAMEGEYSHSSAPDYPHPNCGCRLEVVSDFDAEGKKFQDAPLDVKGEERRLYFAAQARQELKKAA